MEVATAVAIKQLHNYHLPMNPPSITPSSSPHHPHQYSPPPYPYPLVCPGRASLS